RRATGDFVPVVQRQEIILGPDDLVRAEDVVATPHQHVVDRTQDAAGPALVDPERRVGTRPRDAVPGPNRLIGVAVEQLASAAGIGNEVAQRPGPGRLGRGAVGHEGHAGVVAFLAGTRVLAVAAGEAHFLPDAAAVRAVVNKQDILGGVR